MQLQFYIAFKHIIQIRIFTINVGYCKSITINVGYCKQIERLTSETLPGIVS